MYSAAWRVFLPLVESSCQIWFPMLTFAFLSLPLLRKTDVKIRKQTEKRETKRKQETVFYVFLRVSSANIGKFKLSLKALILSAVAFICFLVFSNAFRRTKIFLAKMGFISSQLLAKYRKHALIVIMIVAAIITPPDLMTLVLVTIPLYLLYEVSVRIAKIVESK